MKKSFLTLMAALAMVGCAKNEFKAPVTELDFVPEVVVATLEDGDTKTSMNSYGSVLWSEGDKISVLYSGTDLALSYILKEGIGTTSGTFTYAGDWFDTTVPAAEGETSGRYDMYYGVYPSYALDLNKPVLLDGGKLQVNIPAEQHYAGASYDPAAAVMTGAAGDINGIQFKNATGLLKVFLYLATIDEEGIPHKVDKSGVPPFINNVESITVSSNAHLLAGPAYINESAAAVIKENGVHSATLLCYDADDKPINLNASESYTTKAGVTYDGNAFILALPPTAFVAGEELEIVIKMVDVNGAKSTLHKTITIPASGFKVTRSAISTIPLYYTLAEIEANIENRVAQIGATKYATLADALKAATSGATIEILNGTWGADAIGTLDAAGVYTNANLVRYKSLTIQPVEGATPTFTANVSLGYDDSSTANATMTVKGLKFDGASLLLSNYVQATVEDCQFDNGTAATNGVLVVLDACCKNHKTSEEYPASQITIKNCSIDGSNAGAPAIRLRNSGSVTIDGCTVANSQHNGILFESNGSVNNTPVKTILIKDNTITEWNSTNTADSGRGMRLALGTLAEGSTVTLSDNTLTKANLGFDKPDFAKITGMGEGSLTLSNNHWNTMSDEDVRDNADYFTCDEKIYGYRRQELPAAPTVSGDVINVNAANAQYTLDGAYGSIDGKTINFTENIAEKLVLGRPNKFAGSNTVYRHGGFDKEEMSYKDYIAYKTQPGWTEGGNYNRAISNVTFTANSGVTLAGFTAEGGAHVSGTAAKPIYDYVRDTGIDCYDTNNGYFVYTELTNFKFQGLTLTGGTAIDTSSDRTVFDNFEFNGCTFNINNTASGNQAIHYYSEGAHGNVKNLVVKNCTFNNAYQAVYTSKVVGIHLEGNTVATTGHNAFAIQNSNASDPGCGTVVIKDNTITGCGDRAIRFNYVNAPATITITGNDATYVGEANTEDAIKATSIAAGVTITADENNWNNYKEPYNPQFRNPIAKIGTKGYSSLSDAFNAVKSGEVITLLADCDASDVALTGCNNKTVIIKGLTGNEELNMGSGHKGGIENSNITFLNLKMKIRHTTVSGTWYTEGLYHANKIKYENVVFDGAICTYNYVEFLNCTFTSNPQNAEYVFWNYGGTTVLKGCTFEAASAGTKSFIKLFNQGLVANLAVVDCIFNEPATLPSGWKGCDIYNSNPASVAANAKIYVSSSTTGGTNLLGHSSGSEVVQICISSEEMGITLPTATAL